MKKKPGSILIEVLAATVILSITSIFIISISIQNLKQIKERTILETVNRDMCNLINELKYNITQNEIEEMLTKNTVGFKYVKNFSEELLEKDIKDLQQGTDILISEIQTQGIGATYEIKSKLIIDGFEININKQFTKSWWMDEI